MNSSLHAFGKRDAGFSLIVSLMMLIVIIILGVSGAQMSINEERGARNDRDRQIAFQAAEAALKDAEYEILNPLSPACAAAAPANRGRGRTGTYTCFNGTSQFGFAATATSPCSAPPNEGLCPYDPANPAWARQVDDALHTHIDFLKDAQGTGDGSTVKYGKFTSRTYGSQATYSGSPLSIYPPRYIIEIVPRNTSVDTLTNADADAAASSAAHMFRVTAMGFGTNANTQVVLQSVVATQD
jgi:type IV pilus assembly protein PilX